MSDNKKEASDLTSDMQSLEIVGRPISNLAALRPQPNEVDIFTGDAAAEAEQSADADVEHHGDEAADEEANIDDDGDDLPIDENDEEAMREFAEQYGLNDDGMDSEDDEFDGAAEAAGVDGDEQQMDVPDDSVQGFFDHQDGDEESAVFCIALSPTDASLALSGDQANRAYLWNINTGERLFELLGHTDSVVSVAFSTDGRLCATGSMDATVKIWTVSTGKLLQTLDGPGAEIEWVAFHPKGPILLAGSSDGTAWMWNAEAALCMQVFVGHMGPVLCGLFADKYVCSGAEDGTVIVWSPKTGKPVQTLKGDKFHEGPVLCMAAHPEQPLLLTGSHDGSVFLSQLDNGKVLTAFTGHKDSIESVGFCLQLPFCATGSLDGTAIVWDIKNRQQRCKLSHDAGVVKVKWHPTEPLLFTACIDGAMRLWDARNGALVRSWRGHQDQILDFVMTNDGKKLISCGDDQACLVFDIGTIDGKASS